MDVRHCPRCELRFSSRPELVDHLVVEHGFADDVVDVLSYRRPGARDGAGEGAGRRCLLVANQTIGRPEVMSAVHERIRSGVDAFVVLVPATAVPGHPSGMDGLGLALAEARMHALVDVLRAQGCDARGEVGPADPELAVAMLLREQHVDEILVATLPADMSVWLAVDVPRRLQRRFGLPVTTVETQRRAARPHHGPPWWRGRRQAEAAVSPTDVEQEDVAMDGQVGDRIVVRGRRVGEADSRGEIVQVLGDTRFLVRWADGHESMVVPGADAVIEHEHDAPTGARDLALTVDLRIHLDAGHCHATAVMQTASGVFRGTGEARRHPRDRDVPIIGEELAVGRALTDLGAALEHAARECMDAEEAPTLHLVR